MEGVITKQEILKVLDELPEEASLLDALERLCVLHDLQAGLRDVGEGQTLTQDEVETRVTSILAEWRKQ